ncbi:hypothetical protein SARC_16343, partial [Sphaeroforma arctica JP610]
MCAVKSLQESSVMSREVFMREAQLLKSLNHANIVSFLGLSCSNDPTDLSLSHTGGSDSVNVTGADTSGAESLHNGGNLSYTSSAKTNERAALGDITNQPHMVDAPESVSFYILLEYCDMGAL